MQVWFDLANLYYWPQYEPVFQLLSEKGHQCFLATHRRDDNAELVDRFIPTLMPTITHEFAHHQNLGAYYAEKKADWIIFGNDNFSAFNLLPKKTKTALLYHGIGVKACYYSKGLSLFDVRFTEGHFRQTQLQALYPEANFQEVGFAKLDPLFNRESFNYQALSLSSIGLDDSKKTILYAPTFYPSSIERMPKNWPDLLNDCNIIIKPHFFTWSNPKYQKQRDLLKHWQSYNNVYIAPAEAVSLLPYMDISDLLMSEASSALFEFAALDKPVLWLDFLQLRWSYRGPLRYRFNKRMDKTIEPYKGVALHVDSPQGLVIAVQDQLNNPMQYQAQRACTTAELIGKTDGLVSSRVVEFLERFN